MAKRIYVGNLPYDVGNDQLTQLFVEFGTVVTADVIMDSMTGRSKGFGFVEMSTDQEADAAIQALNGKDQAGRPMTVSEAKPKTSGGGGGGRGGRGGGGGGGRY